MLLSMTRLVSIVALLSLLGCSGASQKPCDQIIDWHECDEASHCAPTHEEPSDPDGPSFSCLPDD